MALDKKQLEVGSNELIRRTNDNARRIRVLEQRLDVIDSRIKGIEERVIDEMGLLKTGFDQLVVDVKELSKEIKEIRSSMLKFSQSLEKTARKSEIKELEALLDIYNPIKSRFVTRDELDRILEEKKAKV